MAIGLYGLQSKMLDGWILHLVSVKNITFKSSYNWFKIDILRLALPLTALFRVTPTTISIKESSNYVQ